MQPTHKNKWKWRETLLFAAPLFCLIIPTVSYISGDALDRKLRSMAGPNAVDCGSVYESDFATGTYDSKGDAMEACADAAHNAGKPFYMRQWLHMDGIKTNLGFVKTPEGKLLLVIYGVPRGVPFFINQAAKIEPYEPSEPIKPRKGRKQTVRKNRGWLYR